MKNWRSPIFQSVSSLCLLARIDRERAKKSVYKYDCVLVCSFIYFRIKTYMFCLCRNIAYSETQKRAKKKLSIHRNRLLSVHCFLWQFNVSSNFLTQSTSIRWQSLRRSLKFMHINNVNDFKTRCHFRTAYRSLIKISDFIRTRLKKNQSEKKICKSNILGENSFHERVFIGAFQWVEVRFW